MHDISAQDAKNIARAAAESMPEYVALKNALTAERLLLRRAVATALSDWVFDPTTDMNKEEKEAFLASFKAELVRRGESLDRSP
jgi:hypothetical protein